MSRWGQTHTDNSAPETKIGMRADWLATRGPGAKVLDAYAGQGVLWRAAQAAAGVTCEVVSIDRKADAPVTIHADNLTVLEWIDLSGFDAIDLDAYGQPVDQLAIVARRAPHADVFVTAGFMPLGRPRSTILAAAGITAAMLDSWAAAHQPIIPVSMIPAMWDAYLARLGYRHSRRTSVFTGFLMVYDHLRPVRGL